MPNLRDTARGRPCQIRVPRHCCFDPATTVLCHLRMAGLSGAGLKCEDLLAAFGCFVCHDIVDGRKDVGLTYDERRLLLLEGIARTQTIWLSEGLIQIRGQMAA